MKCEIVACDRTIFSAEVEFVATRTPEGALGILPRHAPAAFAVMGAPLRLRTSSGEEHTFRVRSGIVSVSPEGVIVLADSVEEPDA
ncbi:F0F1 ATP synthase subunit epsilon [Candidatus Bipolaricaulota sp. J31]